MINGFRVHCARLLNLNFGFVVGRISLCLLYIPYSSSRMFILETDLTSMSSGQLTLSTALIVDLGIQMLGK